MKRIAIGLKKGAFPKRVLLDKGVVRRRYEAAVRLNARLAMTDLQQESADAFEILCSGLADVYITKQTANMLKRRTPAIASPMLAVTQPLTKGRYLRRWARRLRKLSFSREDGVVLAYASFGLDENSTLATIEAVITTDLKLTSNFENRRVEIEDRFTRMTENLSEPYSTLQLPDVMVPPTVLKLI